MSTEPNITTGIIQFAPELGNINNNIRTIDQLMAKKTGIDLWILPELASSGYNFSSYEEAYAASEDLHRSEFVDFLQKKAREQNTYIVAGINERECTKIYNSSVLIGPNGFIGCYRKLHLFNREKDYFEPGNHGFPVFETQLGKIAMLVCFDWMFPEAWRILAFKGAHIICHPSNLVLPYCQTALPGYALTNRLFIASANRTGKEKDLQFTGQSVIVSPTGKFLAKGSKNSEEVITAKIDLNEATNKQITPKNHAFQDRRQDAYTLEETQIIFNLKKNKNKLRKEIKIIKQQYDKEELMVLSLEIMKNLEDLPEFKNAKNVLAYWSLPDEVYTHEFIEKWRTLKNIILPRVVGDYLELRDYTGPETLETGPAFGIQEPTGPVFRDLETIDFVIVPGLAFSPKGGRMGRGKGFYDRTLPFLCNAYKAGVAFPFQILHSVPCDEHDLSVDVVVTSSEK